MKDNINELLELYNQLDSQIAGYKLGFAKIDKKRDLTGDSFVDDYLTNKHECQYWPLLTCYPDLKFLKHLAKQDADEIIFLYGLKKLVGFELGAREKHINFIYDLYLYFDFDEFFFVEDQYLWPRIDFSRKREYLGKYDKDRTLVSLPKSIYGSYVKNFLINNKLENSFNILEWKDLASSFDDYSILLDFKNYGHKNKINIKDFEGVAYE